MALGHLEEDWIETRRHRVAHTEIDHGLKGVSGCDGGHPQMQVGIGLAKRGDQLTPARMGGPGDFQMPHSGIGEPVDQTNQT